MLIFIRFIFIFILLLLDQLWLFQPKGNAMRSKELEISELYDKTPENNNAAIYV